VIKQTILKYQEIEKELEKRKRKRRQETWEKPDDYDTAKGNVN